MIKILFAIFLILITFTSSEAEILLKADEEGKLQANLQNVSLEEVKSFFEESYEITFKGDDNLFQQEVTISFNKLSLEKTLKRIFSKMNVVFKYNKQGKITEVRLLPTSQNQIRAAVANNTVKNEEQQLPVEQTQDPLQENNLVQDDAQKTDEITAFQVEPGAPLPDDSTPVDQNDEISTFQVEVNSPPSGDSFQIVPSAPPSSN